MDTQKEIRGSQEPWQKRSQTNDFLKSVLEQMAEGHDLSSKQEEVLKEIEKEVKEMGEMKKELKKAAQRLATKHASQATSLLKSAEDDLVKAAGKCDKLAAQLKKKGFHVGELLAVSKMCRNLIADLGGDSDIARDVRSASAAKTAAPSSSFEALSAYWLKAGKKIADSIDSGAGINRMKNSSRFGSGAYGDLRGSYF